MKVSVIIPHNRDRGFLKDAIASVEAQTYGDIELILQRGDYGLSKNFNDAVKKSTGVFIKSLAEDDLLPPNSIEDLVNGMGSYDFVTGNAYNFAGTNTEPVSKHLTGIRTLKEMLERNCIHGGAIMYRRDAFERFGFKDESLTTGEEYDMHLSWIKQGAKQGCINKFVYLYRLWPGSKSQSRTKDPNRKKYIEMIKDRYR